MHYAMKWGRYIMSSFGELPFIDDTPVTPPVNPTGWRALTTAVSCITNGGVNTGYVHVDTLEEYYLINSAPTGNTKPNVPSDPNYIADYINSTLCAVGIPETPAAELNISSSLDGSSITLTAFITVAQSVDVTITVRPFLLANGVVQPIQYSQIIIPAGMLSGSYTFGYLVPDGATVTDGGYTIKSVIPPLGKVLLPE
jgi:hypothetical protein